jgi:hypothetical protein
MEQKASGISPSSGAALLAGLVGVGLLTLIVIQFSSSQWRRAFRIKFHRWLLWRCCVGVFIHSKHISRELHPFTLSSTPTRPQCLQITLRASGDWTRNVGRIVEGDRIHLQSPLCIDE